MPYYKTSQEWLEQSSLLLKARPSTARISTKYSIKPPKPSKPAASSDSQLNSAPDHGSTASTANSNPSASIPKATLTLKTFDPVSGVCIKYRTNKAAEVGRLIASLGRLGRTMAALPDEAAAEDVPMVDENEGGAPISRSDARKDTKIDPVGQTAAGGSGGGGGGGGGKKKKKGKK